MTRSPKPNPTDNRPLVILLKIDPVHLPVLEFKRKTPRPVDMDGPSDGVEAVQGVQVETRDLQVVHNECLIKGVKPPLDAVVHPAVDLCSCAAFP